MTQVDSSGDDRPSIFCLHYLGGSAREWLPVGELCETVRCVGIDLPGFGDAAGTEGYSVAEMAATVLEGIRARSRGRWYLAGHSMGAKVACAIAREFESGTSVPPGLQGLVLLAGSPPGPEPMPETQRQEMMKSFRGDERSDRADAQKYIDQNRTRPLDPSLEGDAVNDALRMNRAAWSAWLERGSREDWAQRVGVLSLPALVIAGDDDANLGPKAQERLMMPHFSDARLVALAETKHLLPMERPVEVARAIDDRVRATLGSAIR